MLAGMDRTRAQAPREPAAWTRWISGVEDKESRRNGLPSVRSVRVGVLFDVIVTEEAAGLEAVALMRAAGLPVGPVAMSRGRVQVLVINGVEASWDSLLDHWGTPDVLLRCVGMGGTLLLPRPGREDPLVCCWAVPPTLDARGLPVLTDPLAFVQKLNTAAVNVTASLRRQPEPRERTHAHAHTDRPGT